MRQFSKGVFLFLLTCFFYTVSGRISPDFSECKDFFYLGISPTGLPEGAYHPICQQYKNRYRFATLYSTTSHTPLYSAYKVSPSKVPRPKEEEWMYEPQVRCKKILIKHLNKSTIWIYSSQLCKLSNHKI